MTNEFIAQFNDAGKSSYETFQQFNVINVETMQKLAALQFSLTNLNAECTVAQAKLLTSGTAPQELFAAESALANAYGEKLMQITSETTDLLTQSRDQIVTFAEKTFAEANTVNTAEVKQPRKTATKKAAKKTAKKTVKKAA
ncbi:MAG: phasin family protein [Gammaproteobacteria bacterium]|jgi:phasin family protein|nr:phasin family protein [Gammaproteobacteria bacterium]